MCRPEAYPVLQSRESTSKRPAIANLIKSILYANASLDPSQERKDDHSCGPSPQDVRSNFCPECDSLVEVGHSFASHQGGDGRADGTAPSERKGRNGRRNRSRRPAHTKGKHDHVQVQHSYHDHSAEESDDIDANFELKDKRGGSGTNALPFPLVLHRILDQAEAEGYADAISWQPHGRAFLVHDQGRFVGNIMPNFFRQTRFSSFQRQLSLYGFLRLTRKGPDNGAYYNEYFLRGKPHLCRRMNRTRIKGYWVRQCSSPETEPDLYSYPSLGGPKFDPSWPRSHFVAAPKRKRRRISERTEPESEDDDYDPLPLSSSLPPPWSVPISCNFLASKIASSPEEYQFKRSLPPMPPLTSYHSDEKSTDLNDTTSLLNLFKSTRSVPPPTTLGAVRSEGETGLSIEEQRALADFLEDVDLESENEGQGYEGESNLADIYVHAAQI